MKHFAPSQRGSADPFGEVPLGKSEFRTIAEIMHREARIHLVDGKRTLVHSRLSRRLRALGMDNFRDYLRFVEHDSGELRALVTALTTNHTHFFREAHHFDHLREAVLPQLKHSALRRPVRIWSAGCSSGEEVYTIAMCLMGTDRVAASWLRGADVRLLATDISPPVVEAVRSGRYSKATAQAVPEVYRHAWMRESGDDFEMVPEARDMVTAMVLNLFEPWPMRHQYDVIFCRNVIIYFDDDAQRELESRLIERLTPDGFLYIGHSERLIGPAQAQMRTCGQTIYTKKDAAR